MIRENDYKIGFTSSYINDHKFKHITDIPVDAALNWISEVIGADLLDDWTNKVFIIVAFEHGKFIALNNQDGVFSVRIET